MSRYLTVREAAAASSLSPQMIYKLVAERRIPALHVNKAIRIHRDGFERFLKENEHAKLK